MTRTIPLFAGVAFAVALVLPAWGDAANQGAAPSAGAAAEAAGNTVKSGAEAAGHAIKEGAEATGHAVKKGTSEAGEAVGLSGSAEKQYEAHECGEHRMSGTITAINHETGVIDLKTKEAALQLHYPPKFIHQLKKGERLTVDLAYAKIGTENGPASASASEMKNERAEKEHARHEMGEHWMTGEVTKVDTKTGVIGMRTAEAALILQFPPTAIKDLKTGDHIAVELGFQTHKRMKKEASAKNY
jgi:hypothetical protein